MAESRRKWIKASDKPQDKQVTTSGGGIQIKHQGKPVNRAVARSGLVYLTLDCSGSMKGQKLIQAKQGAMNFAEEARRKGYFTGLIKFASTATYLSRPQSKLSVLQQYMEPMVAGGSTNMTEAIGLATRKLGGKRGFRVIVLVTDGKPNHPRTALEAAYEAREKSIDIITVGTDDADRRFLEKISSRSNLTVMVPKEKLNHGIKSTAKMLPGEGSV